jgi:hypothetical protein
MSIYAPVIAGEAYQKVCNNFLVIGNPIMKAILDRQTNRTHAKNPNIASQHPQEIKAMIRQLN